MYMFQNDIVLEEWTDNGRIWHLKNEKVLLMTTDDRGYYLKVTSIAMMMPKSKIGRYVRRKVYAHAGEYD
jgi:hypothetical protein